MLTARQVTEYSVIVTATTLHVLKDFDKIGSITTPI